MKKWTLVGIVVLLTSLLVVGVALAQVTATDDTYVQQAAPDTTHGGEEELRVRSSGFPSCSPAEIAFLKFDLSSVSEAATSNATLFLDVASFIAGGNGNIHLYEVSDEVSGGGVDWTEAALTYNTAPLPSGTSLATVPFPAGAGEVQFTSQDLADYINRESSYGGDGTVGDDVISFALQIEDCTTFSNEVVFASKESTTATQPAVVLSPTSVALTTATASGGIASPWLLVGLAGLFIAASVAVLLVLHRNRVMTK